MYLIKIVENKVAKIIIGTSTANIEDDTPGVWLSSAVNVRKGDIYKDGIFYL